MNYSPIQLEAMKIFGKKNLTEGCRVKAKMFGRDEYFTCIGMRRITEGVGIYQYDKFEQDGVPIEILGHIPHLEDLFRVAKERAQPYDIVIYYMGNDFKLKIYDCHTYKEEDKIILYNPSLPLIDQPNLEEIISLFR